MADFVLLLGVTVRLQRGFEARKGAPCSWWRLVRLAGILSATPGASGVCR